MSLRIRKAAIFLPSKKSLPAAEAVIRCKFRSIYRAIIFRLRSLRKPTGIGRSALSTRQTRKFMRLKYLMPIIFRSAACSVQTKRIFILILNRLSEFDLKRRNVELHHFWRMNDSTQHFLEKVRRTYGFTLNISTIFEQS